MVYNILCKTLIGAKQLCISFYKVHGFIRAYDCIYQYFIDIIKIKDADFHNILIDEKSYENGLVYNILCKTLIVAKQLRISFYKVHGLIRAYDRIRCLVLFYFKKHEVFSRMRYLIGVKSGITYVFSHNYAKIKDDSYDILPLEKMLTFCNVIIHIKSVFKDTMKAYFC